jgi:hypothetical protein
VYNSPAARFEIFTAVKIQLVLLNAGILPQHYVASQHEDGGSKVLRNVGILRQHYTVSHLEDLDLNSSALCNKRIDLSNIN